MGMKTKLTIIMTLLIAAALPAAAQSTFNVDTGIFITAINDWLGMALSITAIGVGIGGAFALAAMVGRMILNAFSGRGV